MPLVPSSPPPLNARFFQGWVVVAAAFSVLFLAYGLQFSYGVFVTPMAEELGWTRADTALPYSVYVFGYSVLSAVTGRATDRFGPRAVIACGAGLLGIGWGLSALVTTRWQLLLSLGVVASFGMSVAWVPCNATVARWFTRRRGFAVALASSGTSFGNFLVPSLAAAAVAAYGWRATLGGMAAIAALLILVAARFMARDPESVGLWPDGDPAPLQSSPVVTGMTVREALWTEPFLLLIGIYLLTWLVVFVPFVHAAAYAEDLGFGKVAAASVLSAIGIGGVAGRLMSGVLSDRLGQFPALIGIFALQTVSFLLFAYAHSLLWLWLAAAVFGFSYGGGVTVVAPICSVLFGRAHVASVVGALFAIAASPAALGPWLAGWLHDTTGEYDTAFLLSAGVNALALVLSVVLAVRQATRITRGV
jgi:MFS family permease